MDSQVPPKLITESKANLCECGAEIEHEGDICTDCCDHDFDPNGGNLCLNCGEDGTEYLACAAEDYMDYLNDR